MPKGYRVYVEKDENGNEVRTEKNIYEQNPENQENIQTQDSFSGNSAKSSDVNFKVYNQPTPNGDKARLSFEHSDFTVDMEKLKNIRSDMREAHHNAAEKSLERANSQIEKFEKIKPENDYKQDIKDQEKEIKGTERDIRLANKDLQAAKDHYTELKENEPKQGMWDKMFGDKEAFEEKMNDWKYSMKEARNDLKYQQGEMKELKENLAEQKQELSDTKKDYMQQRFDGNMYSDRQYEKVIKPKLENAYELKNQAESTLNNNNEIELEREVACKYIDDNHPELSEFSDDDKFRLMQKGIENSQSEYEVAKTYDKLYGEDKASELENNGSMDGIFGQMEKDSEDSIDKDNQEILDQFNKNNGIGEENVKEESLEEELSR